MTWNEAETRFELQSGQSLGRLGQYYSFLCFIDEEFSYWTSTSKSYTAYIIPSLNQNGQAVLSLGGAFSGIDIGDGLLGVDLLKPDSGEHSGKAYKQQSNNDHKGHRTFVGIPRRLIKSVIRLDVLITAHQ